MLVYKEWTERSVGGLVVYKVQAWYLLGFILVLKKKIRIK